MAVVATYKEILSARQAGCSAPQPPYKYSKTLKLSQTRTRQESEKFHFHCKIVYIAVLLEPAGKK